MSHKSQLASLGGKPVRRTLLPYGRQWIGLDDIRAVVVTLLSDFVTTGPAVDRFEHELARYTGAQYAVAFSSGTAALHAACVAAGIGEGDEVITTPITFAATANCIRYAGGTPVFADIDERTYNIDPDSVKRLITNRTKALIPVHYTGQPADMQAIMQLAKENGLIVIEDAAHAFGASYMGRRIGSGSASMTMFSFHPVKHITTGEGGVITTDDPELYEKLKEFRVHGITRNPSRMERPQGEWYYEMQSLGFNYRLTDVQAALGASQLKKAERFLRLRRRYRQMYDEAFMHAKGVTIPYESPECESSWHLYVLRLNRTELRAGREEIYHALRAENIAVNVHYVPVYLHPYYRDLGYRQGLCPIAERVHEDMITLPLFPRMTRRDVNDVITAVHKVLAYYSA
ncbi:UDP-4-amino-4,6-dideoxy-N-acetyl-beta-L-altrosamine transaminase [Paenibacillus phyllosphaerae]|uniref:UDP-4-amino-4, 6-dideoxy-N-acetyl-beta-L-altrosamine transaminase n=1 Tax=Paenibacillus phyllosphaerae TaxID=274593 RepID=A0A7W5B326_9BACL|nr:UDP-4-amino-4,6-dideoxy-N-acetyl-beta-L-altrosamine transaminase [Paenibacillus phyllosphaerae]MBB3113312.1 UDP-4-amino-4,6-dideoxy-N-acetyl-beta-L-altrosamine transaminase [Paenibacillus phyllosphaerae]